MKLAACSLIIAICLAAPTTYAAEYDDADIIPAVTKLEFRENYVGLFVRGIGELAKPAFVLDRASKKYTMITAREFDNIFGTDSEPLPYRLRHAEPPHLTSSGDTYSPHLCDMYDGVATSETQMVISGKLFPLNFESCISVSEIEIIDNQVWIGTYQAGGHGDYGGVGLVVASLDSGNEIGRIDTGRYPINQVRIDPIDETIWAITRDRIVVVEKNMQISSEYVFYYDFDKETKVPVVHIADEPTVSHPLAVFARSLPDSRHAEFYDAVQTIPDEVARSFSLYDAYMCCYFLSKEDVSSEPPEFAILIPFLVSGFEMGLPRYAYNGKPNSAYASRAWRQIACKHRSWNEEAERLCVTEDWAVLLEGAP